MLWTSTVVDAQSFCAAFASEPVTLMLVEVPKYTPERMLLMLLLSLPSHPSIGPQCLLLGMDYNQTDGLQSEGARPETKEGRRRKRDMRKMRRSTHNN